MSADNSASKPQAVPGTREPAATRTAKLFKNGRSQAVRLPKEFRFDGTEVAIRRDPATGEVVLAQTPPHRSLSFDEWFALYKAIPESAPDEEYAKLPPMPKNLTPQQRLEIIDRGRLPDDFMANRRAHAVQSSWKELFAEWDALGSPDDVPLERCQTPPVERDFY